MAGTAPEGVFEALGEPVRRIILAVLAGGERSAGDLVAAVREHAPISQPAVSQHLRVLRDAALVQARAQGTRRIYALDPAGIAVARDWLATIAEPLSQFDQSLDALATEVARGKRERGRTVAARGENYPGHQSESA
ncbi:winged helix-turn-helix transcriptional regulator [Hoyosella sp. G463]|uniref:Winged helix-turn-helix transcriptional regulator n=1 Tax=Lolliginicoccus lacisalsi TaxID=2742202 RepID=A0A927J9K4_9ACTN|nr:metalloregulator ArsR/SmtB family transcription factor [Lolliginicoccus lacisalsi]MBD8504870.1 winged helix-turn-helix transcriptional regulator [Lolliginicoccus lacisalsi]